MNKKHQKSEDSNKKSVKVNVLVDEKDIDWEKIARKMQDRVKELEAELEKMKNNQINTVSKLILSEEEQIALMQLDRLKMIAQERSFTLDETRQFDILVKNKRLAQGESTSINGEARKVKDLNEKNLIEMASVVKLKEPKEK